MCNLETTFIKVLLSISQALYASVGTEFKPKIVNACVQAAKRNSLFEASKTPQRCECIAMLHVETAEKLVSEDPKLGLGKAKSRLDWVLRLYSATTDELIEQLDNENPSASADDDTIVEKCFSEYKSKNKKTGP